jgi:hypothetical protein
MQNHASPLARRAEGQVGGTCELDDLRAPESVPPMRLAQALGRTKRAASAGAHLWARGGVALIGDPTWHDFIEARTATLLGVQDQQYLDNLKEDA